MSDPPLNPIYNWIVPGATFIAAYLDLFSAMGANFGSAVLIRPFAALMGASAGYGIMVLLGENDFGWPVLAKTALYAGAGCLIAELVFGQIFGFPSPALVALVAASFANYGYNGQWYPHSG